MKVITRAVLDLIKGEWTEEESHEYTGPLARCMPDCPEFGGSGGIGVDRGGGARHGAHHAVGVLGGRVELCRRHFDRR